MPAISTEQRAEITQQVSEIVNALPQRGVIPDEVAERWIDGIVKQDPERAVWHAWRAYGIGGSEIGELVAQAVGLPATYNTLEEISKAKLLLTLPSRENIHMARGTAMEPLAERVYWAATGDKSILHKPEIANKFAQGHPQHQWLKGNPDDVANNQQFGRVITDFKVRSNLNPEEGYKLINICQLHWYGLIHEGRFGELPGAYGLAELDIPVELIDSLMEEENPDFDTLANTIASVNRPGFGIQTRYFKHNTDLAKNMVRLANNFWNKYVLSGTPYLNPKPEKPEDLSPEDESHIREDLNEFLRFKLAEGVSQKSAALHRDRAFKIAEKYELSEWPFEVPGLSAGYSKKFKLNDAADFLVAKGVPRDSLSKPSSKLDADAAIKVLKNNNLLHDSLFKPEWDTRAVKKNLKEHDVSPSQFEDLGFRAGISTKKADLETRETLEVAIQNHISNWGNETGQQEPSQAATPENPAHHAITRDILGSSDNDIDDDTELPELRLG